MVRFVVRLNVFRLQKWALSHPCIFNLFKLDWVFFLEWFSLHTVFVCGCSEVLVGGIGTHA
jgi:hypothetical protein